MKSKRDIEMVIKPPDPHFVGDGFRVHNFFPGAIGEKRMSPFYLLDYNSKIEFQASKKPRGVGVHPHRGFETVSIVYQGRISHHDSAGNAGTIKEGEVQWMTAGSGILHKEYHEKEFSKRGGLFHMVQLWVNLPAKYKMTSPAYQEINHNNIGHFEMDNHKGRIDIIAGSYKQVTGAAKTFSPVEVYNIHLQENADIELETKENYNTALLVIEGEIKIQDQIILENHFVLFKNEGTNISISCIKPSVILFLSGEALNEPIAAYGPFVMNTREEIQQAYLDFNSGKFGKLVDVSEDAQSNSEDA